MGGGGGGVAFGAPKTCFARFDYQRQTTNEMLHDDHGRSLVQHYLPDRKRSYAPKHIIVPAFCVHQKSWRLGKCGFQKSLFIRPQGLSLCSTVKTRRTCFTHCCTAM